MSRQLLDEADVHPGIRSRLGGSYNDTVDEVIAAVASSPVLVIGMAQNPFCKKVRKNLEAANIDFRYLEYGSYFKEWQRRLAIKMWSGWATLPMVFVNQQLVGGNAEVAALLESGDMQRLLDSV
jgi:glutaredoxin-related protein